MPRVIPSTLIFLLTGSTAAFCQSQVSTPQFQKELAQRHMDYLRLNRQIFVRTDDLEAQRTHVSSKSEFPPIEAKLREKLDEAIAALAASGSSGDDVKKAIDTIQGELGSASWGPNLTNLPFAEFAKTNAGETLVAAFVILEGGDAIPDSQPFIEFYTHQNEAWNLKATVDSDFKASTLFISRINAGLAGENWYLTWGKQIGDSGSYLNLRLYAFDGRTVRTVWKRDDLAGGVVKVSGDSITLDYKEGYPSPTERAKQIHEDLHVTVNGLQ